MTILVHCSDPRVVKLLSDIKIAKNLSIDDPYHAVIANTGSIKYFMYNNMVESFTEQLEILAGHFKADKIVLLNHTDCGYYKSIGQNKTENYTNDLMNMKFILKQKFVDLKIECFLLDTKTGELEKI